MFKKDLNSNILKPLSKKKFVKYNFIGFDVETIGDKNEFFMGGLYYYDKGGKEVYLSFFNKEDMQEYILSKNFFRGKFIVATNLSFDLSVLFFGSDYWNNFRFINRDGNIILCEKSFDNSSKVGKLKFIDTFNYVPYSVKKLGEIIGINKLEKPACLGRLPINKVELDELINYNRYDCKISCDFMHFLQNVLNVSGGNLKLTIGACALDVWRRNFLKNYIIKEDFILKKDVKDFIFKGYFGGRTEVYKKGFFKSSENVDDKENLIGYYDINSLYPSCMLNKYPLPSSVMEVNNTDLSFVLNYFGVSEVEVVAPVNLNKPFLPLRNENKLIFPLGKWIGIYNHNELQKALSLGYKIKPIKTIIYTKTFYPFKEYVEHFYNLRQEYKENKSNFEFVVKLLLNSLYGKFSMKYINNYKIINHKIMCVGDIQEQIEGYDVEQKGDYLMLRKKELFNGIYSFPIFSSYTTSYARIKMYDYINDKNVLYTDTDSIFVKGLIYPDSKKIGELKLECVMDNCFLIKPKMYSYTTGEKEVVRIKGLSGGNMEDFNSILEGGIIPKMKFIKLRESFIREMCVNEKIILNKSFMLDDNKRNWIEINKELKYKDKIFESIPIEVRN